MTQRRTSPGHGAARGGFMPLLRARATALFAVATAGGVALALWNQRDAIRDFEWTVSPGAVAAAALLFAVPVIAQGLSWWVVLRFMGAPSRLWPSLLVWMRGFLVRYAPSGALMFALRVRERDRMGLTRTQVVLASGYEQLAAPLAGAIVAVGAVLASGRWPDAPAVLLLGVLLAGGVLVRPAWGGRVARRLAARRGVELPGLLRGRHLAVAVAVDVAGWPFTGAAAWLVLDALTPDPPPFREVLGAYAFAWLLGVLVPLLPGGLGLREATLAALLAGHYGLGVATTLALGLRVVNTLGEFVAIGLTEAAALLPALRDAGRPAGPPPGARGGTAPPGGA